MSPLYRERNGGMERLSDLSNWSYSVNFLACRENKVICVLPTLWKKVWLYR